MALLMASCSDYLKESPKTMLSPDKPLASPQALKLLATGLYSNRDYFSSPDCIYLMCLPADDMCSDRAEWDWEQSDLFTQTDPIDRLAAAWKVPYTAIANANQIIEGYPSVPVNGETDQALVNNIAGQAYFVRGHWLLFLSRFWGPVPMPLVNDGTWLKKSSVNAVFDQGIADLIKAEELLPWEQTEADWKRDGFSLAPLKFAAKAWLAQAYLQSTGWPLFRTENYAKAAQKAKEVIEWANANPNVLGLLPADQLYSGQGFWDKECVWGMGHNINGPESQRCAMGETPDEEISGTGWATNLAEILFFNQFPEGKRKDVTFRTTIWVEPATPELSEELNAFKATLSAPPAGAAYAADWPVRLWNGATNQYTPNQCRYTWKNFNPDTDLAAGKFFYDQRYNRWNVQVAWDDYVKNPESRRHPYYAKQYFDDQIDQTYVPGDRQVNEDGSIQAWGWETRSLNSEWWRSGKLTRWMRYAEVLLIYAEAQAMANGLDQSCIDALNQVRARAEEARGLAKLSDYGSAQEFQKAMFDERGWEFAGLESGQRWADLLRFEKVKEMNTPRASLGNWPDGRPKEKALNSEFIANEKKFYYLLIPGAEKARTGFKDNDASVDPVNPQD